MKTNNSILVTAPEIAKDLGISTTSAYKLIHKWNAELEAELHDHLREGQPQILL